MFPFGPIHSVRAVAHPSGRVGNRVDRVAVNFEGARLDVVQSITGENLLNLIHLRVYILLGSDGEKGIAVDFGPDPPSITVGRGQNLPSALCSGHSLASV